MRMNPLPLIALIACAVWTQACAPHAPAYALPPRLTLPVEATTPCTLDVLPSSPTEADFEAVYALRGQTVALCEGRRDLAVQTHREEHRLIDEWMKAMKPRPWWRLGR